MCHVSSNPSSVGPSLACSITQRDQCLSDQPDLIIQRLEKLIKNTTDRQVVPQGSTAKAHRYSLWSGIARNKRARRNSLINSNTASMQEKEQSKEGSSNLSGSPTTCSCNGWPMNRKRRVAIERALMQEHAVTINARDRLRKIQLYALAGAWCSPAAAGV